ncbi:MAG: LysM peptidoglycan-binding domain-containing protein [Magnetospirillum sp. WYHS-4]
MQRPVIAIAVGIVAVGAAVGIAIFQGRDDTPPLPAPPPVVTAPAPGQVSPRPVPSPRFDVVRVNPDGEAVFAGRGEPGSRIVILDGKAEMGHVKADGKGEWVHVPVQPLKPGTHELSLEMQLEGRPPLASDKVVVIVVPERAAGRALALAVPREGGGETALLQRPGAVTAETALAVDTVDYDEQGRLSLAGRAAAGSLVQLYLDQLFLGRAEADESHRWLLKPTVPVAAGLYTLRADQIDAAGKVLARITLPFSRAEPLPPDAHPGGFAIVQPGNSLWRLARRVYGTGHAFTVIYEANQDHIGDPDLIYPGQIFALPVPQENRP